MFKIGDIVILRVTGNSEKCKDSGREAVIVERGKMYDWRINMLHRDKRVNGSYDWGANIENLELANGGPW